MRIGLISDVHSNYHALKAVLDFLNDKIDVLICSGDFVGYGPSPGKCIDSLIDFPIPHYYCVGNHDLGVRLSYSLMNNLPSKQDTKILSHFSFRNGADEMITRNATELREMHYYFLLNLPYKRIFQLNAFDIYLTHGTPSKRRIENVGKYLFPPPILSYDVILNRISKDKHANNAKIIIVGHSHQRFIIERTKRSYWSLIDDIINKKQIEFPLTFSLKQKKVIINPGSVGQSRDGTGNASFAIINLNTQEIIFHDLNYPREEFSKLVWQKCPPEIQGTNFWSNRFGSFSKQVQKDMNDSQ